MISDGFLDNSWYMVVIVDLFLHETQLKTGYGYILLAFFLACFKFTSDILLVSASHRIVSTQLYDCYQIKRYQAKLWLMLGELLVILLIIASLYYLGSLLSNEILWLEVANADIVSDIVTRKSRFQLAFFVVQFIITLGTLVGAGSLWYFRGLEIVVS